MPINPINSLRKGLSILTSFTEERSELTLTALAKLNRMTLGTAHRYLVTLKQLGYLTQDIENKKYRLTTKILSLGFSFLHGIELRKRLLPHMVQLTKELDVTSLCAILDCTQIVFIERVRSTDVVNLDLTVGSRLPAHATSMGKVILAFLDEKRTRELIKQMNLLPITPYTITDKNLLFQELKLIRQRGYAMNNQEFLIGLRGVSAPVFKNGEVEGAFGVTIRHNRLGDDIFEELCIKRVLDIAKSCSI
jgi:IclR family pca regulon transcriptional regulator